MEKKPHVITDGDDLTIVMPAKESNGWVETHVKLEGVRVTGWGTVSSNPAYSSYIRTIDSLRDRLEATLVFITRDIIDLPATPPDPTMQVLEKLAEEDIRGDGSCRKCRLPVDESGDRNGHANWCPTRIARVALYDVRKALADKAKKA